MLFTLCVSGAQPASLRATPGSSAACPCSPPSLATAKSTGRRKNVKQTGLHLCCGEGGSTQQHPWLFLVPTVSLHHLHCPSWKCHGVFHSLLDSWAPLKCFAALNVLVFCLGSILLQLNSHLLLGKNNLMLSAPFHCPGNIRCPLGHPRPPRSISLLHTGILIYSFFSQLICKYQRGQHLEEPVHILVTACVPGPAAAACSGALIVIMCCGMLSLPPRGLQHIWGHLPSLCLGLGLAQCSDKRQVLPLFQECQGRALPARGGASHPAHTIRGLLSPGLLPAELLSAPFNQNKQQINLT